MSLEHLLYEQEQRANGYSDIDLLRLLHAQLQYHHDHTHHAATTIQRRWRGYSDRKYIAHLHTQATTIQRIFRGFLARRRVERIRADRLSHVDAAHCATLATLIQRVWRGHHSRTHYADYYRRRLYIQRVTEAGQQVSADMTAYQHSRTQLMRSQQQQHFQATLQHITRHTHHTLSTAVQPSVWRSRWGEAYDTRVGGRRLEELVEEESKVRERELRRLRAGVRRAQRQQQAGKRIQEMFIAGDDEDEDEGDEEADEMRIEELDDERVRVEAEEKQQMSLDVRPMDEATADMTEAEFEEAATADEAAEKASDVMEATVVKSRFPPIHRKPTYESERVKADEEREKQSLNRSIIWSREGRPITVERPREQLLR